MVCFAPGLDGYYYFFQQDLILRGKYNGLRCKRQGTRTRARHKVQGTRYKVQEKRNKEQDKTVTGSRELIINMKKLPFDFYNRENVLQIAEELMGKLLVTKKDGVTTSGRIVECEAYAGAPDKASHAFDGRKTNRNEVMYGKAGVAYV